MSTANCATLAGLVKFAAKQQLGKCSRSTRPTIVRADSNHTGSALSRQLVRKSVSVDLLYLLFFNAMMCNLGSLRGNRVVAEWETGRTPPTPISATPTSKHQSRLV